MSGPPPEDDDDDDEVTDYNEYRTLSMYQDRLEKIRLANQELKKEEKLMRDSRNSAKSATKVRFSEMVTFDNTIDDWDDDDSVTDTESYQSSRTTDGKLVSINSGPKVLLVTVPTGCERPECSEEVGSDSSDDTFTNLEGISRKVEKEEEAGSVRAEVYPEEELGRTQNEDEVEATDETKEEELAGWFSKSVSLEPEEELEMLEGRLDAGEEVQPLEEGESREEVRPSTAFSVRLRRREERPATAPTRRPCCARPQPRLPAYNGLRSEYGLTAEQLKERDRRKAEVAAALREKREACYHEQKRKRKENEATFNRWLIQKKREAEARAARRLRIHGDYCFRTTLPAPTSHLDRIGILRRKMLRKENTCFLLNEIFRCAKPHEQKTYRIYLGLSSK